MSQPRLAVNGFEIPGPVVLAEMQYHPAETAEAAFQAAAQALVLRQLLRRAAGLPESLEPDSEAEADMIDDHLMAVLQLPEVEEAACRRYYDNNQAQFRRGEVVSARHILLAAAPDDSEARQRAEDTAKALQEQLLEDPGRFAELAAVFSACPSKQSGGDLGQLQRGSTVPEFERTLFALPLHNIALIESRYGWHVVEVESRLAGELPSYDEVASLVAARLQEGAWRQGLAHYLRTLVGTASIEGLELAGSHGALMN